jgi:hypothetical protein
MEPTVKPGYKTTEFWLSLFAILLGAVVAAGVVPATGPVAQAVALVTALLSAAGYTVARSFTKSTEAKSSAIVAAHTIQATGKPMPPVNP